MTHSETIGLEGKTAIVTGGNRGLGRGVVEALAKRKVRAVVDLVEDPARFPQLAYVLGGKGLAPLG